mmetsp:Transcript_11835/g.30011  ORF Transcript_11835/g.30011 Transcript_11835/m.30011 type:complete len:577 (+) Transcript_11835:119-1849(+)
MAPPKKKRRLQAETSSTDIAEDDHSPTATISRKDLLTKELVVNLDALEAGESSVGNNASIGFLKLKALQRGVLSKMRQTQELLKQQAIRRDQQELQLENLCYQQAIHEKQKRESDRAVESTTLEIARLVRKSSKETSSEEGNQELLNKFLGEDWKDFSQREAIVAKLNQEVTTRKTMKDELDKLKQEQTSKQDSLISRQKLLKDLPLKLADMEKASLPLQKFCHRQNSATPSLMKTDPKLGTTKRRNRLDQAKTLTKALYTLFHQLQSCLDVMETNQGSVEASGMIPEALPTVEIPGEPSDVVVLKIPIPTLSQSGETTYKPKKQASILFRYDATLDVVLAACGTDYDMGQGVIDELFPGDRGEFSWTTTSKGGKPYAWCNYLAGLHISPTEKTAAKMHSSARVIVKALCRRVRAIATLSWILHNLSRKPSISNFPTHCALREDRNSSGTKLSNWTLSTKEGNQRVYKAVLQRGTKQIVAKVTIDLARYPSSIPKWKILSGDEDQEEDSLELLQGEAPQQLPLYNETLARLEQEVNQKVDRLVVPSDQTTYDWILGEQLAKIAEGWEESLQDDNAS